MNIKIPLILILFTGIICAGGVTASEPVPDDHIQKVKSSVVYSLPDPKVIRNGVVVYSSKSLQDAINHSRDGDTIAVEPGAYNGAAVNKRVKIVSTSPHKATVKGFTILPLSQFKGNNYLEINGFIITNPVYEGVNVNSVQGVKIIDNIIQNNKNLGIFMNKVSNCIISGNTIQNNKMGGLHLKYSKNNVVEKNNFRYNNDMGLFLLSSSLNKVANNYFQYQNWGISVDGVQNTITNNIIYKNNMSGIILGGHNHILTGNTMEYNKDVGLRLENSYSNQIKNNTITGNLLGGVYLRYSSAKNQILSNKIYKNHGYGIKLEGKSTQNTISRNTITYNNIRTPGTPPSGINLFTPYNHINQNIIEHNQFGIAYSTVPNYMQGNTILYNPMGNLVYLH